MNRVYVDNNATTMVAPEVRDAMQPLFDEFYGNPSSMHVFGAEVEKQLAAAREQVATFLGAEPSEIIFTSCGTESDNAAIRGLLESVPSRRHILPPDVHAVGARLPGDLDEIVHDQRHVRRPGDLEHKAHDMRDKIVVVVLGPELDDVRAPCDGTGDRVRHIPRPEQFEIDHHVQTSFRKPVLHSVPRPPVPEVRMPA